MEVLTIPFYEQNTDYTCGPASLRMVLAYYGRSIPEEELVPLLGTNDAMGTERNRMGEIIKSHNLIPFEQTDATLDDLRHLLQNQMPVIVRYLEEEENSDHYGVVVGINDTHIILNDPWFGPDRRHELGTFLIRWPCTHEKGQTCWMLGVGDREL
jgi:predicted double-glycine peptidase